MQFFLHEIVARIVAIYLCVDCGRDLWSGLVERKIAYFSTDFLDWLLEWSNWVVHRDAAPVQYWIQMGFEAMALVACFLLPYSGGGCQTHEHPLSGKGAGRVRRAGPDLRRLT
jgi:hypothetical protein